MVFSGYPKQEVPYCANRIQSYRDSILLLLTLLFRFYFHVMFIDNLAYLSCGFGIVVLDIDKEEIADTYYIGPNGGQIDVHDLTYNDTSFFAATETGIFSAYLDSPNLAYFGSWSSCIC